MIAKIRKVLSVLSKVFVVVFIFIYCVIAIGGGIAEDNKDMISMFLGQMGNNTIPIESEDGIENEVTDYYTSQYGSVAEVRAAGFKWTETIMEEGAVLLRNENNALPLAQGEKVSLFSASSVFPVISGVRESANKKSDITDLKAGFEAAGLNVNANLYDWYYRNSSTLANRGLANSGTWGRKCLSPGDGLYAVWSINEAPWSALPAARTESGYKTAIFILSRVAGEGVDVAVRDLGEFVNERNDTVSYGNYLMLSQNEKDVLRNLKDEKAKGTFDKIIVLLNTTNQVAIDYVDEFDVDAILYTGSIGSRGSVGIGNILTGKANPSGKLSDTFWKNHYLNPVLTNWGAMSYDGNGSGAMQKYRTFTYDDNNRYDDGYTVYQEGIYSGYRYTETRYEDVVLGTANVGTYNYNDVVAYPFGYGISYTNFSYSDFTVEYDAEKDAFEISVTVTNTGAVAGKNSPQIFLQKPYTEYDKTNGIEKSAVEFVAYGKTKLLQPEASETVKMTVNRREFASYDSYKEGTYILENGNYYFAVGNDAHDAINNILAAKAASGVTVNAGAMVDEYGNAASGKAELAHREEVTGANLREYDHSVTGEEIVNNFDGADLKLYEGAGEKNKNSFEYITRNNWNGTVKYAFEYNSAKDEWTFLNNYVHLTKTTQITKDMGSSSSNVQPSEGAYPTMNSKKTAWRLIDLRVDGNGNPIPYDDPMWDDLLDQLSWDDMVSVLTNGGFRTGAIESVSKPQTYDNDSDLGVFEPYSAGGNGLANKTNDPDRSKQPATYLDNGIVAATRNPELLFDYGVQWGEDCLWAGYTGLYGAGCNTHRSPYLGRTYGYYSEDPVLMGKSLAQVNLGMESKGAQMLAKHCMLNEQEVNRIGGASWANEQTIREVYLKSFQIGIEEGSLQGVMTGLNRIGAVPACHHNFINEVMRDEFGMQGYCVTDSYMGYMNIEDCVLAGNDLPLASDSSLTNEKYRTGYADLAWAMRRCVHNILFTIVHSNAMNGMSSNTRVINFEPEWHHLLGYFTKMSLGFLIASCVFFVGMEVWVQIADRKERKAQPKTEAKQL